MAFQAKLAREMGLKAAEAAVFARLKSPAAVQDFLASMPSNPEPDGDTCFSVRTTLQRRCCHCIEAAFFAACALMLQGRPALLLDFEADGDDDHVVALFKEGRHWGAISKSNHVWLRWRDPVYRSVRELAMSYFHEYVWKENKTLRRISRPFNIGAYDPAYWVTRETDCWEMEAEISNVPHYPLITPKQARNLTKRDRFEIYAGTLKEFDDSMRLLIPKPKP